MDFLQKVSVPSLRLAAVLLLGGGAGSAMAQFKSDQRLDEKLDHRVVASKGERGASSKEGLDISLVTSLAYDSNILLTAEDEQGSLVAQVEPSIGWTAGERDKAWVRLAYEGSAIAYFSSLEDSRIDSRVVAEGGLKSKSVELAYSARWARLGSPSADAGGQVNRMEWGVGGSATYSPKGKMSYRVFADRSAVEQIDATFFDFYQSSGGVAAQYRYSPKTEVEVVYQLGQVDVDDSGVQTFQRLGVEALWRPRPKLSLSVAGGFEHRNYEVGTGFEPYLSARVNWTPRAKTALYLEAYRRVEASAVQEGENFVLGGFRAGVSQRLRDGWSAGLDFGRESADYFGVAGLPESGRTDTLYFIRPSVRYAWSEDTQLVFLYQWSKNDSSDPDFGFDNHQVAASVSHRF